MAIQIKSTTVQKAPVIPQGGRPFSYHVNQQNKAFNDRLEIGAGDSCWRIFYDTLAQVRHKNPLSNHAAFFDTSWVGDPMSSTNYNLVEHLNKKNPVIQFCFGRNGWETNPNEQMTEESLRLTHWSSSVYSQDFIMQFSGTDRQMWNYITASQGAMLSGSNERYSPAMTLARRQNGFYTLLDPEFNNYSVFNGWGGFCNMPAQGDIIGQCEDVKDISGNVQLYNNTKIIIRHKDTNVTTSYSGTCVNTAGNYYLGVDNDNWYIYKLNDDKIGELLDTYPRCDYTIGPYNNQGGSLQHTSITPYFDSNINNYLKDFRGKYSEWYSQSYMLENAFDTQKFCERYYNLAPHYGYADGLKIKRKEIYFQKTGGTAGWMTCNQGGETYNLHKGFYISQYFIDAHNVTGTINLTFYTGSTVLATLTNLTTYDETSGYLHTFEDGFDYDRIQHISVHLDSNITIGSGGYIKVYLSELEARRPDLYDLYWFLRLSSFSRLEDEYGDSAGEMQPALDNKGTEIYQNYYNYGCPVNVYGYTGLENLQLGHSAIAQSTFNTAMTWTRYIKTEDIIGYEYINGSSSIYLLPTDYMIPFFDQNHYYNNGMLMPEWEYIIIGSEGSNVKYLDNYYYAGDTFTGSWREPDVQEINGDAIICLKNNILHSAPKEGYSNEWLCTTILHPWRPAEISETSEDPDDPDWLFTYYNDMYTTWPLQNKALWGIPKDGMEEIENQGVVNIVWQENGKLTADRYGNDAYDGQYMDKSYVAEFPSAYSFYSTPSTILNASIDVPNLGEYAANYTTPWRDTVYMTSENLYDAMSAYCKSNIVYKPPMQIECIDGCASMDTPVGTVYGVIKITFKGRMHHHENAPEEIRMSDITGWTTEDQDYRTDENGIMDWLIYQYCNDTEAGEYVYTRPDGNGPGRVRKKIGEFYSHSTVHKEGLQAPIGSIPPTLILTKEIPYVYEDLNETYNMEDTRVEVDQFLQKEFYLKAMCQGFVSGIVDETVFIDAFLSGSIRKFGETSAIMDYYYEKLCLDALGRCRPLITDNEAHTKPSYGVSQLPNCNTSLEQFNQFSKMINKLDKMRLMFPFRMKTSGTHKEVVTNTYPQTYYHNDNYLEEGGAGIGYATDHISPDTQVGGSDGEGGFSWWTTDADYVGQVSSFAQCGFLNAVDGAQVARGYMADGASYAFEIDSVYKNALPYDVDPQKDMFVFAIDEQWENWWTALWTTESMGCLAPFTRQLSYQLEPPPMYGYCNMTKMEGDVMYFLHPNYYENYSIKFYQAPYSMDVSLTGTGKGDAVWNGYVGAEGQGLIGTGGYGRSRQLTFLKDHSVIQLVEEE